MDTTIIPEACTRIFNLIKAFGENHVKDLMDSSRLDINEPGDFLTLEEELEFLAEKSKVSNPSQEENGK